MSQRNIQLTLLNRFEGLEEKLGDDEDDEDDDMLNRFNQLRAAAIKELPKAGMLKSINVDLDKLL